MGDITERTKLLEKERENSLASESYELANQRDSRSCETPNANERSADEIGINTALEPGLGRKTWKGYLILILTPLVLCPLPIFLPSMVGVIFGSFKFTLSIHFNVKHCVCMSINM